MFQLEKERGKHVHHSLQSKKFERVNHRPRVWCVYPLSVCVFVEQSACLPAEQPRLCMNRAAYQLTFKLEPQSDCRPKGWRSHLIGCSVSDLLTIEINRARWAYPQAEEVWECREIGGGGDCINIKIYFHYFPQLSFLKLQERRKKSLCAVKHANGGAGKNRRARYYLDFISHSFTLSFLPSLSFLSLFPPLFLYFNGGGVLARCDCLIDRYLLLERGTWKRRGLGMRCVFSRPQGQGALCVCGGWWITWGPRVYVCVWVCVCICVCVCVCVGMVPSVVSLCTQWKHGSELIFHTGSWKRSLNKTNVCEWESPGINFNTIYATVQCSGSKRENYVVLWTRAQVAEYTGIRLAFCQIKMGWKKNALDLICLCVCVCACVFTMGISHVTVTCARSPSTGDGVSLPPRSWLSLSFCQGAGRRLWGQPGLPVYFHSNDPTWAVTGPPNS